MKKINILLLILLAAGSVFVGGCKKDNENTPSEVPPQLTIEIDHLAGLQKFYFDSTYTTANGDLFSASLFKYYVSNVRLIRTDNSEYSIPETYFLVNNDVSSSLLLNMDTLSAGSFKGIKFILGVDSAHNVSGAKDGALDPVNGMFWDWNNGYIFFKLEGISPAIPGASQDFTYHIGGFSGQNINYKEINLDFNGDILQLVPNKHPELHLVANVLEVFKNPNTIDLATFPTTVTSIGADATTIADNYADMFRYDHMHND
jgi:hypothetical protein